MLRDYSSINGEPTVCSKGPLTIEPGTTLLYEEEKVQLISVDARHLGLLDTVTFAVLSRVECDDDALTLKQLLHLVRGSDVHGLVPKSCCSSTKRSLPERHFILVFAGRERGKPGATFQVTAEQWPPRDGFETQNRIRVVQNHEVDVLKVQRVLQASQERDLCIQRRRALEQHGDVNIAARADLPALRRTKCPGSDYLGRILPDLCCALPVDCPCRGVSCA